MRKEFRTKQQRVLRQGFSLVETLVVLTVIGILAGVGFVNYRGISREKELEKVKKQVVADIRLAQANALAGKKPKTGTCSNDSYELVAHKFYVYYVPPTNTYNLRYVCYNGSVYVEDISERYKLETQDLTKYMITISPADKIYFKVLGEGVVLSSGTNFGNIINHSSTTIIIEQMVTGEIAKIVIKESGEIIE